MNYRKFKADKIFTGEAFLGNDHILITTPEGEIVSIEKQEDAGEATDTLTGIITPGFINAHCHLELSHMKGVIPEKTGLVDFVFKVVTERHFEEATIQDAIREGEKEMLAKGIVAVGDICNNPSTYDQKQQANLAYYNFIEASGWLPSVSVVRFERALNLYRQFEKLNGDRASASIVPHAPYSVSNDLWMHMQPWFKDKVVTMHNQETAHENEFFLQGTGDLTRMYEKMNLDNSFHVPSEKSSLQTCFTKLTGAGNILLVHNTFTGQEDIDFVNRHRLADQLVSYCICINANQYIEDALPPVELFDQQGCKIVLGTDSLASNHSLDILSEMKTIQKHFPAISLAKLLRWATLNGARALGMDTTLGSFEKGKKPGIVLIENAEEDNISFASSRRIL